MTNWQTKTIKEMTSLVKDGTHGTHKEHAGGIPLLSAKDINNGTVVLNNSPRLISEAEFNSIHKGYSLRNNDILLTIVGSLGRVAILQNYHDNFTFQRSVAILRFKDSICAKYMYYVLTDWRFQKELLKRESKGAQGGVYLGEIAKIKLTLPEKPEQERIVGVLEVWDEYIEQLERKIALKEQLKKGLMQQLLIGKRRLPGFTSEWRTEKVSDLFDIKNGYTPSKRQKEFWQDGTIPWFRMEDIRKNGRILSDSIQRITPAAVKGGGLFPANSIIIATTATIGEHALLIADSLANQQFTFLTRKVNCLDLLDPMFVYYACFDLSEWCKKNTNSGGLTAVDMNGFKKYKFPVPDIAEQTAIVDVLQNAEQTVSLLKQEKQMAVNQKKYLLQNLITGKIRTPENMEIAK